MKKRNQDQVHANSLAVRLKHLRQAKGLTKYRLAKISGLSETYIYRIERGLIENPRRDTLQKLAHGLAVPVAFLIAETPPSDTWQLLEHYLKAYIPVYPGIEDGMTPVDYVAYTTATIPRDTMRAYRADTFYWYPDVQPDDTLVVDTALPPENGDLVIAIKDGQPFVQKYREDHHGHKWLEDKHAHHDLDAMPFKAVITHFMHRLK
ncbi:MAG: LexA family transcriptional regulator [Dehalococcoidia bacterium]